jgi:hypothetical protein
MNQGSLKDLNISPYGEHLSPSQFIDDTMLLSATTSKEAKEIKHILDIFLFRFEARINNIK